MYRCYIEQMGCIYKVTYFEGILVLQLMMLARAIAVEMEKNIHNFGIFIYLIFLLNLLELDCLIKLYRFQVYSSPIYHLYIVLCVYIFRYRVVIIK